MVSAEEFEVGSWNLEKRYIDLSTVIQLGLERDNVTI